MLKTGECLNGCNYPWMSLKANSKINYSFSAISFCDLFLFCSGARRFYYFSSLGTAVPETLCFLGCASVRPILMNTISQEHLDVIYLNLTEKHPLGLKDELIIIWWSTVKVTVTSQNMSLAKTHSNNNFRYSRTRRTS